MKIITDRRMACIAYPQRRIPFGRWLKWLMGVLSLLVLSSTAAKGQGTITYHSGGISLSGTVPLKCDPMSEDDPNDLAECYSFLVTYMPGGDKNRFEMHFPARKGVYHWIQEAEKDKSDSLSARFIYDTNPKVYGNVIDAYPTDFTIKVTRYDNTKGGIIEGAFSGTMQADIASSHSTVTIDVKGSFHTIRNGRGDECRKTRRSEDVVIENAKSVVRSGLETPLQDMGWQVTDNQEIKTVISNIPRPYRPMGLCDDPFDMKLTLDPNTDYGKTMTDSAVYYSQLNTKEGTISMFRVQEMRNLEIRIFVNSPFIKSPFAHEKADKYVIMHPVGAAFACRFINAPRSDLDSPHVTTCLFFGNWNGADMNATNYLNYPFVHKQGGPYLENLEVQIIGPAQAADDIVRKIDWKTLNAALTK